MESPVLGKAEARSRLRAARRARSSLPDAAHPTKAPPPDAAAAGPRCVESGPLPQPGASTGVGRLDDLALAPGLAATFPEPGEWVAAFRSTRSEPSTALLLSVLAGRGLRVLVPAVGPPGGASAQPVPARKPSGARQGGPLSADVVPAWVEFHPTPSGPSGGPGHAIGGGSGAAFESGTPTDPGATMGPEVLQRCRLVLVPALAVDRSGTRLGQGGGWYDRALIHVRADTLVLAVCFPPEVLPPHALPYEPHDQPVDGCLTSAGVEYFRPIRVERTWPDIPE